MKPKKIFDEIQHWDDKDSLQLFIGEDNQFYAYYKYTNEKFSKYNEILKIVDKMEDESKTSLFLDDTLNFEYKGIRDLYIQQKRLSKLEQL